MNELSANGCGCGCGCTSQQIGQHTNALCQRCAADDGRAIVMLTESPSTGYVWRTEELPAGVSIIADHYLVADPDRRAVGGTGRHLFVLAGAPGDSVEITWRLGRPWMAEPLEWLVTEVTFGAHSLESTHVRRVERPAA